MLVITGEVPDEEQSLLLVLNPNRKNDPQCLVCSKRVALRVVRSFPFVFGAAVRRRLFVRGAGGLSEGIDVRKQALKVNEPNSPGTAGSSQCA